MNRFYGPIIMASVALAVIALAMATARRCTPDVGAFRIGHTLQGGCAR